MFEVIYQSKKSKARVGRITTPHGVIETPNFVPVGTNGTMKAVDSLILDQMGIDLMFCNTYHLMVQPGSHIVAQVGGLHRFMQRSRPIITDSGGFQVFSLKYGGVAQELKSKGKVLGSQGGVVKISEEGVLFRSYKDGHKILLTPETSIAAQKDLGADLIVAFDELPPYHMKPKALMRSLDRTHRWELRSLEEHKKNPNQQALYAVIHGGIDKELRKKSVEYLAAYDFDGFAIGGSVGKNQEEMMDMLGYVMSIVPKNKPHHLLGIADLTSIHQVIPLGVDTFDSAYPTKAARHGTLYTKEGPIKIEKAQYSSDLNPIEPGCLCHTCRHYSRAYIRHLFKAHELQAYTLSSIHNLYVMNETLKAYRKAIQEDRI